MRQPAEVNSPMKRTNHHKDVEMVACPRMCLLRRLISCPRRSPKYRAKAQMLIHLINLDRSTDRLADADVNDHLDDICRVSAVDGNTLNLPALIQNGVIERSIAETYRKEDSSSSFLTSCFGTRRLRQAKS